MRSKPLESSRRALLLAPALAVLCASACRDAAPERAEHARALVGDAPPALYLRPAAPGRTEAALRGGGVDAELDFATVRVRGEQFYLEAQRDAGGERVVRASLGARRGSSVFAVAERGFDDGEGRRVLRSAKALCYVPRGVWSEPEASPAVCARFGTALEIVPMRDPHTVQVGEDLPVRVRFEGPGLVGATLVAEREVDGARVEQARGTTASVGELDVPIARAGLWSLRVQHVAAGRVHVATLSFWIGERG